VLKEKVFGNQMRDQYHYDDEDRLIKKTTVSENGEIVYETQYRWNHNDEIISKFKNYF
jgi:antitoxin component YwqK of YwqJK toxin-antitoxin module